MERKKKAAAWTLGIMACLDVICFISLGVFAVKYWGTAEGVEAAMPWAYAAAIIWIPLLICVIARLVLAVQIRKQGAEKKI